MRLKKTRKKKTFAFNLAFTVDKDNKLNKNKKSNRNNKLNKNNKSKFSKNTSFREKNQVISIHVCDEKHWFSFYLYSKKNKRFIDWKSDVNIQKK